MKSIEARFRTAKEKNPYWSDWVTFYWAVRGQGFGERAIRTWFKKLVPKDDYPDEELKMAILWMEAASNSLRTTVGVEKPQQN